MSGQSVSQRIPATNSPPLENAGYDWNEALARSELLALSILHILFPEHTLYTMHIYTEPIILYPMVYVYVYVTCNMYDVLCTIATIALYKAKDNCASRALCMRQQYAA